MNSTDLLLTQKNNYRLISDELTVNKHNLKDLLVLAEVDLESRYGFKIQTKGRLDIKPSLAVSAKLEEIYDYFKKYGPDGVSSIFVNQGCKHQRAICSNSEHRQVLL